MTYESINLVFASSTPVIIRRVKTPDIWNHFHGFEWSGDFVFYERRCLVDPNTRQELRGPSCTLSSCLASGLLMPGKELRMEDYLKAYKSTGKPPLPCPQSPDTPNARATLSLPPLFVPAAIPVPSDGLSSSSSSTSDAPATLPENHEFSSTKTITGEYFESISAQTLYNHFSHEVGFHRRVPMTGFPLSSISSSYARTHAHTHILSLSCSLCRSPSGTSFFILLVRSS